MLRVIAFALIASAALPLGALAGIRAPMSRSTVAMMLGFASGALISAVAFELFDEAYHHGGVGWASASFLAGATAFVLIDNWLERRIRDRARAGAGIGFALLAAVTLDGVPENLAMGVSLIEYGSVALLVAIFVSNFPEAAAGAKKMKDAGFSDRHTMLIWIGAAVLLAAAVLVGYLALDGASGRTLSVPLAFAAGAVLASLADTIMPEAFEEGGTKVAYATALGFLLSYVLAVG
ncbi:MAG: hypothetical protein KDB48_03300 [Solirubrobacterales bacterium]|nr:hypothetical protein [Solirubrobacterales bacterium]HMT04884.1 hypothetical protein [Solirubrobacterales bacterium]